MRDLVINNLVKRFDAYDELIKAIDDDLLKTTIEVPKHKSLADHLWCVVGARESYTRALEWGAWQGFKCSLTQYDAKSFQKAFALSKDSFLHVAKGIEDWTPAHDTLLADLSEHEVMHEGQIIRHIYALELELPSSWKWA